jgi:triosephosphate isomerase
VRRLIIAGNWKMNLSRGEGLALAEAIAKAVGDTPATDVVLCPPAVYLDAISAAVKNSVVSVGAQNVYFESSGAYTGEVSVAMLKDVGCQYVILGHSERRAILGETDEVVNKKLHAALAGGLVPIVCVGETLEDREAGKTMDVVGGQVKGSLAGLNVEQMAETIIAYEPVWAIGTGKVATTEQAQEVHAAIRSLLAEIFDVDTAEKVRIQYGGSVKPDNAGELLAQKDIDGALVGGASLKEDSFMGIITSG